MASGVDETGPPSEEREGAGDGIVLSVREKFGDNCV